MLSSKHSILKYSVIQRSLKLFTYYIYSFSVEHRFRKSFSLYFVLTNVVFWRILERQNLLSSLSESMLSHHTVSHQCPFLLQAYSRRFGVLYRYTKHSKMTYQSTHFCLIPNKITVQIS